jgi:hypothetical protein
MPAPTVKLCVLVVITTLQQYSSSVSGSLPRCCQYVICGSFVGEVGGLLFHGQSESCACFYRRETARDDFHHLLASVMPGVNLAFFSLAGASLALDALGHALWMACIVCSVRLVAVVIGSHLGCWVSASPPEHKKRMWQSMITQVSAIMPLITMQ